MNLLDLMDTPPPPKPTWRAGQPTHGYRPYEEGDLCWMPHDYRDLRKGGRWFRFDADEHIWRCIDPLDQTGINKLPDTPPAMDRHGRLIGNAA